MDKEFLEKVLACKTSDELRSLLNSRRQLSEDELEQVNGGALITGKFTRKELRALIPLLREIESLYGKSSAVSTLFTYSQSTEARDIYEKGSIDDVYNHVVHIADPRRVR